MAAKLYNTTRMSRYYNGPVSDHFDGARFFDPHGAPPRSRRDLLRWFVDRHWRATKSKWPAWAPSPYADRPLARIDGAAWRISYVGHASWLIQTAGFNMLLDPVWSKRASPFRFAGPQRVNDPGIAFADLPPIDVVLVSHGHYDHLDLTTLSRLAAAHRARVITPLGDATAGSCQAERRGTNRADLARAKSSIPITSGHSREAVDDAAHPSEQY